MIPFVRSRKFSFSPGQVAQLVRASLQYAKVVDSVPHQGTYKNQSMNVKQQIDVSMIHSLSLLPLINR